MVLIFVTLGTSFKRSFWRSGGARVVGHNAVRRTWGFEVELRLADRILRRRRRACFFFASSADTRDEVMITAAISNFKSWVVAEGVIIKQ